MAAATGCSQSHVHYMLKGDRTVSVANAIKLEQVTGICREGWVFPERHWNPYIPFSSYANCGNCKNKIHRIRKTSQMMIEYFKNAENKHEAIQDILEIPKVIHGYQDSEIMTIREITSKGIKLLAYIGQPNAIMPKLITENKFKESIDQVKNNNHVRYVYGSIEPSTAHEHHFKHCNRTGIKSINIFSSKRHLVLTRANRARVQRFKPKAIKTIINLVTTLDQVWHDAFYT
jgi:hypothetical protein